MSEPPHHDPWQQPSPYGPPPGYPYGPPPGYGTAPTETSGGAIASMVLGIVSMVLCCFGWVAGIIAIGLVATSTKQIYESGGRLGGGGMAIAGLVLGIIALVVYLPWMLLWMRGVIASPTSY